MTHKEDLIAAGEYAIVEIFEVVTGQRRAKLPTNGTVTSLAFSPDDAILVTGNADGRVRVWDLQTGGLVDNLEEHTSWIRSTVFSPDGTMIATTSDDYTIRIWDVSSRDCRCILEGHSDWVNTVCWSATGNEVISGSRDTSIKVWSISNSSLIASGSKRSLKVLDAETGDVLHTIPTTQYIDLVQFLDQSADVLTFRYNGWARAISSDGTRLVTMNHPDVVKIWQMNPPEQNQDMAGRHNDQVYHVCLSRGGQLVASASLDETAKIWDTTTGQCITTFHGHSGELSRVSFSPDSTVCGSWGYDEFIRIWDVKTGNQISTFREVWVYDMCFSPNGSRLAFVSLREVKLLEVATGKCLASMQLQKVFHKISFHVDGTSVILRESQEIQRFILSSTPHESDTSNPSPLPMVFVPIFDTDPTLLDLSPRHPYHYDKGSSWILDGQNRRMLWVPPDFRQASDSCGNTVAFGSISGIVAIVDFRL